MADSEIEQLTDRILSVSYSRLSTAAQAKIDRHLLDTLTCIKLGNNTEFANWATPWLGMPKPDNTQKVFASQKAAMASYWAATGHATELDDVYIAPVPQHPSIIIVPALFAVASEHSISLDELRDAYLTGIYCSGLFGHFVGFEHYRKGWHATATFNAVGAAAAVARFNTLKLPGVLSAMLATATLSAGTTRVFGTHMKPLQVGRAASNAVLGAEAATAGLQLDPGTWSADDGIASMWLGDSAGVTDTARLPDLSVFLGDSEMSLQIKRYPSCYGTHSPLTSTLSVLAALSDREISAIRRISLNVCTTVWRNLNCSDYPTDESSARFSPRYAVAAAIARNRFGFAEVTQDALADSNIRQIFERITVTPDPELDNTDFETSGVIESSDSTLAEWKPGSQPNFPLPSDDEIVLDRFRETFPKLSGVGTSATTIVDALSASGTLMTLLDPGR